MLDTHLENVIQSVTDDDWDMVEAETGAAYSAILQHQTARHFDDHNYALSTKYANELRHHFPESSSGHYWEGRIWEEKLYFSRAVLAYQKAIQLDPADSRSQEKLLIASKKSCRKVDFVSLLPAEILLHIFGLVPDARFKCMRVSRPWQSIIFALPQMWAYLNASFMKDFFFSPDGTRVDDIERSFRSFLGPCLKYFQMTTDIDLSIPLFWITKSKSTRIIEIVIFDRKKPNERFPGEPAPRKLHEILPYFATSLTHLTITSISYPTHSYMLFLLSLLPKLQSLQHKEHGPLVPEKRFFSPVPPQISDLRLLAWPLVSEGDAQQIGEYFAAYCPKLRDIAVTMSDMHILDASSFLDIVLQKCRNLRCFSTGPYRLVRDSETHEHDKSGLEFALIYNCVPFLDGTIASVLEHHQQTLEELYYTGKRRRRRVTPFDGFERVRSPISFLHLRTLSIDTFRAASGHTTDPLAHILRKCPVLQNVHLSSTRIGRDIATALAEVPQVTMLTLYDCAYTCNYILSQLLEALKYKDTLKGLTLEVSRTKYLLTQEALLVLVASIGSLRYLRLIRFDFTILNRSIVFMEEFIYIARNSGLAQNLVMLRFLPRLPDSPTDTAHDDMHELLESALGHALKNEMGSVEIEKMTHNFGDGFINKIYNSEPRDHRDGLIY
ncbi:hypothetical protein BCR43DRAFT_562740 [Syncephalastrum racemosum]|uniref:F-box domain-containing protein n=1 Tax=Syncephalastrum racemosum TaxID=13706 RepID=A0A1X2HE66_SYNRA|nr:hypothetical protein BCR43DRAFT_562740 [Syncephalastrum racemosum]